MAKTLQENGFHTLMATLTLASILLEEVLSRNVPGFDAPKIGLLTLTLAWVWLARVGAFRLENADDRLKVAEDRLERLERAWRALEDERRYGPGPSGRGIGPGGPGPTGR